MSPRSTKALAQSPQPWHEAHELRVQQPDYSADEAERTRSRSTSIGASWPDSSS